MPLFRETSSLKQAIGTKSFFQSLNIFSKGLFSLKWLQKEFRKAGFYTFMVDGQYMVNMHAQQKA